MDPDVLNKTKTPEVACVVRGSILADTGIVQQLLQQCRQAIQAADYSAIYKTTGIKITTAQLQQLQERAAHACMAQPIVNSAAAAGLSARLRVTDGGHSCQPAPPALPGTQAASSGGGPLPFAAAQQQVAVDLTRVLDLGMSKATEVPLAAEEEPEDAEAGEAAAQAAQAAKEAAVEERRRKDRDRKRAAYENQKAAEALLSPASQKKVQDARKKKKAVDNATYQKNKLQRLSEDPEALKTERKRKRENKQKERQL